MTRHARQRPRRYRPPSSRRWTPRLRARPSVLEEPDDGPSALEYLEDALEDLQGAYAAAGPALPRGRLDHVRRSLQRAIQAAREAEDGPTPFEVLTHHLEHWRDQIEADADGEGAYRPPPGWWKAQQLVRLLGLQESDE